MTVKINLLPRRTDSLIRQTRRFYLMFIAATGSALLIVLVLNASIREQHHAQQQLIHLLQKEHDAVDRLIRESEQLREKIVALHQRQHHLQSLQQQRNDAVRLLSWLAQHSPHGVFLHMLTQDGKQLVLNGRAESHRPIAELMENLQESASMFRQTALQEVHAAASDAAGRDQRFAISANYLPVAPWAADRNMVQP